MLEKLFKSSPWKVFTVSFLITTVLFGLLFYSFIDPTLVEEKPNVVFIIPAVFGFIIGSFITLMIYTTNKAGEFYDKANEIESMIYDSVSSEEVVSKLKDLSKMSFHRNTSQRVRELTKMTEVKYGIKVLK